MRLFEKSCILFFIEGCFLKIFGEGSSYVVTIVFLVSERFTAGRQLP